MLVGDLLVYIPGLVVLQHCYGLSVGETLRLGLLYFLPGDALKVIVATLTTWLLWRLLAALHNRSVFVCSIECRRLGAPGAVVGVRCCFGGCSWRDVLPHPQCV